MTEQEKWEKVIKGLECCTKDECECCPYEDVCFGDDEVELFDRLARDALALLKAQEPEALDMPKPDSDIGCWYDITHNYTLEQVVSALKAQEPRVMTLEKVKQWCDIHPHKQNPIWVEFQHGHGTNGWRVGLVNSGLLAWCKDNEARCWTSRPTDEQREVVPWN